MEHAATPFGRCFFIHGDADIIELRVADNPKCEGSMARQRFAQYRDGMTVSAYLRACNGLDQPDVARKSLDDLKWDVANGFIRIIPAEAR